MATASSSTAEATRLIEQLDQFFAENKKAQDPPEELLQRLEALSSYEEPNRSPNFLGEWNVWYTNCPPPSNGQLGPFQGTAGQIIDDAKTKSYKNLLKVPPNDWLTATLDGIWEEWDGKLLVENSDVPSTTQDWGANHWKVTFLRLEIKLLGFKLLDKEFPPETARVWRTTYLDDNVRIVRAGKTGRVEDEVVFYTKRETCPWL